MPEPFSWRELLAQWRHAGSPEEAPGAPPPLAEFYAAGGRSFAHQNPFYLPIEEDGWSVFSYEQQGCCRWAFRTGDPDPDPCVFVSEDGTRYAEVCRLDAFITAAAMVEAALSPPAGMVAGQCPEDRIDEALGIERVELPHLGWPAGSTTRYYRGPASLGFATCHGGWGVAYVGARDDETLRALEARLRDSPDWEGFETG